MQRCLAWIGLLVLAATPAQADPDAGDVLGRYWLPDRDGQIEMTLRGDRYVGRVVAYDEPEQLDVKNPDPALRERTFLGIDMFAGFHFDARTGRWTDGTIYDARAGKVYVCEMWFEGDDRSVLWARGYVGIPLFGRTQAFERVADSQTRAKPSRIPVGRTTPVDAVSNR